jgi:hypothetical protein
MRHRWVPLLLVLVSCAPALAPLAGPSSPVQPTPAAELLPRRPVPYPVVPPLAYQRAVEQGTRTAAGAPGPAYWQNHAEYRMRARVHPERRRLEGSAAIRYHNRSPDTLGVLVLDLAQNLHAAGAVRNEAAEVTGGVELARVTLRGRALRGDVAAGERYLERGTKLILFPEQGVAPGESVELEIDWAFDIPQQGAGGRMGHSQDNLIFLAYWYPQMTVYDDVIGWHPDEFQGRAEFYAGFATYQYTVEAPAGWLVRGTGELTEPERLLEPAVLQRWRAAAASDTVVRVVTTGDLGRVVRPAPAGGLHSWTFHADSVRDVAFSLTRDFLWDVTRSPTGAVGTDGAPRHARIEALYRTSAPRWHEVARYSQHSIAFLSRYMEFPYPWPHMTAVEGAGIIGGGMEFPMMTIMGDYTAAGDAALYSVTAHELAHMWVPMIVSTDERRYGWMDEGITMFNEAEARRDFLGADAHLENRSTYLRIGTAGGDAPIMRWSDHHYNVSNYFLATYPKPSVALEALRGLLGEETFNRGFHEFISRWAYRHPYPWDLWRTFDQVSGRDLSWFWRTWFHEAWLLDQAVASVTEAADGVHILVEDRGDAPMPVHLTVTRASGETTRHVIAVDVWLQGARHATLTLPAGSPLTRVEIDAEGNFPDADRANNVWRR